MRTVHRFVATICIALAIASCATSTPSASPPLTFVVVRHAEKATDDPRDPTLAPAGIARAQTLATHVADGTLVAAYATRYRRTQLTATPSAQAAGLAVITYDADQPADAFATRLRAAHASGTVLVVGHSNTVPAIAGALCKCAVPAIDDATFDVMHRIDIAADGTATLRTTTY